jgi:hypothetical protein
MGMDRSPVAQRSKTDLEFAASTTSMVSPSNVENGRDLRIHLLARLFESTREAMVLTSQLVSPHVLDDWYDSLKDKLHDLTDLHRLMLPLEREGCHNSLYLSSLKLYFLDLVQHEKVYFHMMLILYLSCRILILQNAIQHVFNLFYPAYQDAWALQVRPHGHQNIVPSWEKEVASLAESILLCFIQSDKQLLSTCPDIIFPLVTYAAVITTGWKFQLAQRGELDPMGSSDQLLKNTAKIMFQSALSTDHVANRCGHMITAMVASWETRQNFHIDQAYLQARSHHESLLSSFSAQHTSQSAMPSSTYGYASSSRVQLGPNRPSQSQFPHGPPPGGYV